MIEMSRPRRGAWAWCLLLVALLLAGCAESAAPRPAAAPQPRTTTSAPPAAATTELRTFAPYDHATLTVPVSARQDGTCWTTSISVPRPGVFRCLAANQIFDPCFAPPGRHASRTVACFADPWSPATVIHLVRALPRAHSTLARSKPWALQLANGATCVSVTGTVRTFAGESLDYTCARGRAAALAATGSGRHSVLHADYGVPAKGNTLSTVVVTVAWD